MIRPFPTGQLRSLLRQRTDSALRSGALEPMETRAVRVDDEGVPFVVRIVEAIERKENAARTQDPDFDPFLPYDERLFVADVSPDHVCLLNKYYVLDDHLLVVTRDYQPQLAPLTVPDFRAWRRCMVEFPAFGFYNGGPVAGASQTHKHMQVVGLPLARWSDVPMEHRLDDLPFPHHLTRFHELPDAETLAAEYHRALERLELTGEGETSPYNLLLTSTWMLAVPRSTESFESISVNGLGFAGAMLVRNDEELDTLTRRGIMTAVTHCAGHL